MSGSLQALRRANPRGREGFEDSVFAAAAEIEARIAATPTSVPAANAALVRRRRLVPVSVGGVALAIAAAVAVFLTVGSGRGPGVQSAAAALRKAVGVSAAAAEQSGTAVVRITHNGEPWAGSTIRWNGNDLSLWGDYPVRPGEARSEMRLVGGMMYGIDNGAWVELGPPESIDPGSGTTPAQYLAAVRADVGGDTLRTITAAARGLTTRQNNGGSIVYSGVVAAGVIAPETSVKGGQPIRMLPFGYVAHDEAADPASPLNVAVTVGADGIVREILVDWGTGASTWTYTVTYSALGTTPAPAAPAHPQSLRDRGPRRRAVVSSR